MKSVIEKISPDDFYCTYCGKNFRNEPIRLAIHIKKNHDEINPRNKLKK